MRAEVDSNENDYAGDSDALLDHYGDYESIDETDPKDYSHIPTED